MATSDAPITIDSVSLTVNNLALVGDFYERIIGLRKLSSDGESAAYGANGKAFLHLRQDKAARRWEKREPGLYHTAFLLPDRGDLGAWLKHLGMQGHKLTGRADHAVSEALYLDDPEGNGIEVYVDKPRSQWPYHDGMIAMTNSPIDLTALADAAERAWDGIPAGSVIGHVHMQVASTADAEDFWTAQMKLDLTCRFPKASFLSSGGYHHHVAVNTWQSDGAAPRAARTTGLAEVVLASQTPLAGDASAEPNSIPVRVISAPLSPGDSTTAG